MPSARFRRVCWNTLKRWWIPFACSVLLVPHAVTLHAQQQDQSVIEALAGVLAVEDARTFGGPLLRNAARHPDPVVRRHAALALGRIGNRVGVPTLIQLLSDPDTVVQADAAYALGLLRDPRSIAPLRNFVLQAPPASQGDAHAEAVSAIT